MAVGRHAHPRRRDKPFCQPQPGLGQPVLSRPSALTLTWITEAGGIYQLQSSASLNTPHWTNLGSPVTATGGSITFTDSVTNAPQRFYRLSQIGRAHV